MINTRDDVIAAVQAAFPGRDPAAILGVLDLYGTQSHERERERVHLAVVALSDGNEDKLLHFIQAAKTDYRDVLHWHASGPLPESEGRKLQQDARTLIEKWGRK